MKILAIESSCDETAAAIIEGEDSPQVLSNVVSTQIDIHKEFGGVVPEVAARAHIENIIPVIKKTLTEAKTELSDLDYITVTEGPGLVGSLVVGVETAKAISVSNNIPIVPVNHLEGHIYANFLEENKPEFPLIALLVSGGHTLLIFMKDHLDYQIIGSTRDDAAGEAFDKAAKILGLGYPGGPIISHEAEKGNENKYKFPTIDLTPQATRNPVGFLETPEESLDFSFSGLKTALITKVKQLTSDGNEITAEEKADLSASFQKAIIDNLSQNVLRAVKKYQPKTFILSGGVAANKNLRETLEKNIKEVSAETSYLIPPTNLCTDNAAMIGAAAFYHAKLKKIDDANFAANPNLKLNN